MTRTESSAGNSASQIPQGYSIDSSSISRSRLESPPWTAGGSGSGAIQDDRAPSVSQHDPLFPPSDKDKDMDNADKKPVWNKPSSNSAEGGPVMGAHSWPALSLSAKPSSNKSPPFESQPDSSGSSSMPMPMPMPTLPPQAAPTPPNSSFNATAATSSDNHHVNGQRKPFRRNNSTSSSSTNPPNAAPFNTRDHNHSQRNASYAPATTPSRNSHKFRNGGSSYPRGDSLHHGNRRNFDHGNQTGFSHRNYTGRDMHLQPQRGFGMMRQQILMGPPSFPASSAQYMATPQLGSYGGPMLYPDYPPQVFMPHPPPESMALVGQFPPPPMYFSSVDPFLYNKILTQVEYYFSADNLSKDKHLRRQMNDEGWVPVRVIAGFRRLAELTNDIQTVLVALRSSEVVEIKGEALRRRGDWDKYLLPHEPSGSAPAGAGNNNASLGSELESMTLSERSREGE